MIYHVVTRFTEDDTPIRPVVFRTYEEAMGHVNKHEIGRKNKIYIGPIEIQVADKLDALYWLHSHPEIWASTDEEDRLNPRMEEV